MIKVINTSHLAPGPGMSLARNATIAKEMVYVVTNSYGVVLAVFCSEEKANAMVARTSGLVTVHELED
jgi:hypothetical protein